MRDVVDRTKVMKKFFFFAAIVLHTLPVSALDTKTQTEVTHLLDYLGTSGCQFNRNDSWHSAVDAKKHLTQKYEYLSNKNMISDAESFIARGASESSMSGKPYWVQCGNSAPVKSAQWLGEELQRFRARGR